MASQTLLDIAKLNGNDMLTGLIEDNLNVAPEFAVVPARTIRGTSYRTVIRTGLPTVGFRDANGSTTASKSSFENRMVEAFILSSLITVDKAVAQAYEDGPEAWQALEASGVMKAAMQKLGTVFYYGRNSTHGDTKGFPGLLGTYDSTNNVVDAGGTTATTGSSVWLVKFGPQDVQWVVGNNGSIDLSDFRTETISGVPSYVADLTSWIGAQTTNENSIVRIKKLTADSGKGLTDSLIAEAISKFPAGVMPDAIFMNRRSMLQLQRSRTVVINANGNSKGGNNVENIPAIPSEAFGIPIHVTDQISSVEALTL